MEDPIFGPWSVQDTPPAPPPRSAPRWRPPSTSPPSIPPAPPISRVTPAAGPVRDATDQRRGTAEFLREVVTSQMQAISRRLRIARHDTQLDDLLDEPPSLLRFHVRPWLGHFARSGSDRSAMLEIGLSSNAEERVTAWYWLDELGEAPDESLSLPVEKLTASWIERVILDFVAKVLERS